MHQSAMLYGQHFFNTYCASNADDDFVIVEIGSQNVNGSLRDVAPDNARYIGLDFVAGNGVDVIIDDPYQLPLPDESADFIVTSSCFEHSEFFWLVLLEALRVLKKNGLLYLNAPSNGFIHRWPVDCWRFYPDSGHAMVNWANRNGYNSTLLESFIGERSAGRVADGGAWNDFVAVIAKDKSYTHIFESRILESLDDFSNGYTDKTPSIINNTPFNPDSQLMINLSKEIDFLNERIDSLQNNVGVQADREEVFKKEKLSLEYDIKNQGNRIEVLKSSLLEANNIISNLESELSNHKKFIEEIRSSNSWRLTAPVRFVGHLVYGDWNTAKSVVLNKIVTPVKKIEKKSNAFFNALKYGLRYYGALPILVKKSISIYKKEGVAGINRRINTLSIRNSLNSRNVYEECNSSLYEAVNFEETSDIYCPLVSVIVPNYNHEIYLKQRLDSIYNQTYKKIEVILLDDCSTDDSREILSEYAEKYPEITKLVINDINSGGVFQQWKKGFSIAKGGLVWIAESDDFCDENFLSENINSFKNEAVMLSFSRTVFVKGANDKEIWTSDEYMKSLGLSQVDNAFVKSAHRLVNECWGVGNLVANVSSAVFRHPGDLDILDDIEWSSMKVCGDWVFYLHLIRGGLVAYTPNSNNYYRQHDRNTSTSNQSNAIYYQEYEFVAKNIISLYKIDDSVLHRLDREIKNQWSIRNPEQSIEELNNYFSVERALSSASKRKPNVLMATYAFVAGGGETFPILLANLLKKYGYAVTFFNWCEQPTEIGVKNMLNKNIPILQLKDRELTAAVISDMGIEVTHSHHACVDMSLAALLLHNDSTARVISMHGMYEMIPPQERAHCLSLMERSIHRVVYTAEKNLAPFSTEFQNKLNFKKISNALPKLEILNVDLSCLGIGDSDFVICLVSRAIPEKGWQEAIDAVNYANGKSKRRIHLILIGEGEVYDLLSEKEVSATIHFLGFKNNIRDYFAAADIGLLPSRFKGESYPLVLIDCLLAGTPVVASNVGEIASMVGSSHGNAGVLFDLMEWHIPVENLSNIFVELSDFDSVQYKEIYMNVPYAAAKFSEENLIASYGDVYGSAINELVKKV